MLAQSSPEVILSGASNLLLPRDVGPLGAMLLATNTLMESLVLSAAISLLDVGASGATSVQSKPI